LPPSTNVWRSSPGGRIHDRWPPGATGESLTAREADVFSVRCPRHRRWVLLGPSDIVTIGPGPHGGFGIGYRCTCGYEGQWPPAPCEEEWKDRMAG
jgi:hypothetical protein